MTNLLSIPHFLIAFITLLILFISSQISAHPYKSLVAPLVKEPNSTLFSVVLNHREHYLLDLDASFSWFRCHLPHPCVACNTTPCHQAKQHDPCATSNFSSQSLYEALNCCSDRRFDSHSPHSSKHTHDFDKNDCNSCVVRPFNPLTRVCAIDRLTYYDFIVYWTNGRYPTAGVNFNQLYISCAPVSLLRSLPARVIGVASFSWSDLSLAVQFTTPTNIDPTRKFALCMPSDSASRGTLFIGDGPYYLDPSRDLDISSILSYTPLIKNPEKLGYYVGLKGIFLHGTNTHVMTGLSDFKNVKFSTTIHYTTLRTNIYKIFLNAFEKATKGNPRVEPMDQFDICFKGKVFGKRATLRIPRMDLMLSSGKNWTLHSTNVMKQVKRDVACLAFVDGGENAEEEMVIGSFQMENNIFLFDLVKSRLGFSSSLFFADTSCSAFNFRYLVNI